jgi:hypothetical protein
MDINDIEPFWITGAEKMPQVADYLMENGIIPDALVKLMTLKVSIL